MGTEKSAVEKLIGELAKLPGIGIRTATRLTYHLLNRDKEDLEYLIDSLRGIIERAEFCSICFNVTEIDPCAICSNSKRDHSTICVVSQPQDLMAIEATQAFEGVYHVLGGLLDALAGVDIGDLKIAELNNRVNRDEIDEVILALDPTAEGETTARYIAKVLKPSGIKVTILARGISAGSVLEFADKKTLTSALQNRIEI